LEYCRHFLSGSAAVAGNKVGLIPIDLTFGAYQKIMGDGQFGGPLVSLFKSYSDIGSEFDTHRADGLSIG
jgi:hypothetical protein